MRKYPSTITEKFYIISHIPLAGSGRFLMFFNFIQIYLKLEPGPWVNIWFVNKKVSHLVTDEIGTASILLCVH